MIIWMIIFRVIHITSEKDVDILSYALFFLF